VNRPAVQVLIWAGWLTLLTVILWIWWGEILNTGELAGAALLTAAVAAGYAFFHRGRRQDEPSEVRMLPDVSVGATVTALGLCGMLFGAEFGLFFVLICAGVTAVGVGRLAVELVSERRQRGGGD
jgi:hypothetical protein